MRVTDCGPAYLLRPMPHMVPRESLLVDTYLAVVSYPRSGLYFRMTMKEGWLVFKTVDVYHGFNV
jgi:hypothetical protein